MSDEPRLFRAELNPDERTLTITSITLRDFFAGLALAGTLAPSQDEPLKMARRAYEYADAMLVERQKGEQK